MTHQSVAIADLTATQTKGPTKDHLLTEEASNHLVLACTKSVFNLITTSTVYENTYKASLGSA
jgi:hypothetical protein